MALDDASYPILWDIFKQTGIRPEWLLPVLGAESGLNPAIPNQAGQPFYGINQASAALISQYAGTDPQTYLTWPASQQLDTVVRGFMKGLVASYGPLRSGVRVYQANFLPGTLNTARKLEDVITSSPSAYYNANKGLDSNGKGYINLQDLANFVARAAATGTVKAAVTRAYTDSCAIALNGLPIGVGQTCVSPIGAQTDPVYGEDFPGGVDPGSSIAGSPTNTAVVAVSIVTIAAAVAYGIREDVFVKLFQKAHRYF